MPIAVSIVEDNDQLRGTLARVIGRAEGFKCVSQYANAEAALEALPKDRPEVVLMDINLPGMNGVECVRQLKQVAPQIQSLMLTVYEDTDRIFKALSAGANGYLLKRAAPAKLLEAIRDVHAGGSAMSSSIARKVVASFQKAAPALKTGTHLSPREQAVLDCLAKGMTYKAIADQLGISIETIRTHLKRVYQKLHVQSRTEAVAKYMRL